MPLGMNRSMSRRRFLKLSALGSGMLIASPLASRHLTAAAASGTSVEVYDDFSGGETGYNDKWFPYLTGPLGNPVSEAAQPYSRDFGDGHLHVDAHEFTMSYDNVDDHIKYLRVSTSAFEAPSNGSITISADIAALTPGVESGHIVPASGRVLLEAQQACATLHLLDFVNGGIFDWLISERRAFPLYERLFFPGVGLDQGYTQIPGATNTRDGAISQPYPTASSSQDFAISPGMHNYAIRYSRNLQSLAPDLVEWLLDGVVVATVRRAGVPLDTQIPGYYGQNPLTYPAMGPGEELKNRFSSFNIGHGLFSLVDEYPFNQFDENYVSIPLEQRVWGQGAIGDFANVTVTTEVVS